MQFQKQPELDDMVNNKNVELLRAQNSVSIHYLPRTHKYWLFSVLINSRLKDEKNYEQ